MTTGEPLGLTTFTLKVTSLLVVPADWPTTVNTVGSCCGMRSTSDGVQTPFAKSKNDEGVPRKTFRSNLFPGTPYLGAMPQEEYCHTVHCESQLAPVQE